MDNEEKILRYLSELMDKKSREKFENELETDTELRNEFNFIKHKLDEVISYGEVDEPAAYLNSLTNVYKDFEKQKSSRFPVWKFVYSAGFALSVLIGLLIFKPGEKTRAQFLSPAFSKELAAALQESEDLYLTDLFIIDELNEPVIYQSIDIDAQSTEKELDILYSGAGYYLEQPYFSIVDEYTLLKEIDESTADELYDKMEEKTFISKGEKL